MFEPKWTTTQQWFVVSSTLYAFPFIAFAHICPTSYGRQVELQHLNCRISSRQILCESLADSISSQSHNKNWKEHDQYWQHICRTFASLFVCSARLVRCICQTHIEKQTATRDDIFHVGTFFGMVSTCAKLYLLNFFTSIFRKCHLCALSVIQWCRRNSRLV